MTKWNSNDLMDKMESPEPEESQGKQRWGGGCSSPLSYPITAQWWDTGTCSIPECLLLQCGLCVADGIYQQSGSEFRVASSVEQLNIIEVSTYPETEAVGRGRCRLQRQSSPEPCIHREAGGPFLWGQQTASKENLIQVPPLGK